MVLSWKWDEREALKQALELRRRRLKQPLKPPYIKLMYIKLDIEQTGTCAQQTLTCFINFACILFVHTQARTRYYVFPVLTRLGTIKCRRFDNKTR